MADVVRQTNLLLPCKSKTNDNQRSLPVCPSRSAFCLSAARYPSLKLRHRPLSTDFYGHRLRGPPIRPTPRPPPSNAQPMGIGIGKGQRWWERGLEPNLKEVSSAQDLVDSLLGAGDVLVVVDFFSPGCGGCKALHPKICQLAQMNPDVQFLQVNYEEHKSMCYALNVHVLPFFRFYRGAHGRLCSFSCTNATIKKFKDALAKHSPDRCSLGPPKGLEEKELLALAANKDLSFVYKPLPKEDPSVPVPVTGKEIEEVLAPPPPLPLPLPLPPTTSLKATQNCNENLVSSLL